MKRKTTTLLGAALLGLLGAPAAAAPGSLGAGLDLALEAEVESGWIARPGDNICGIKNLKRVSSPATADEDELLSATSEMQKLRDDRIDPSSPEGIRLRQLAKQRVLKACETVRSERGFCGIWKAIRHSDGRAVPDVTGVVKVRLPDVR